LSLCLKCYRPTLPKARYNIVKSEEKSIKSNHLQPISQDLDNWYRSPLGRYLAAHIKRALDDLLATSFGYYALHLGCRPRPSDYLAACRTKHIFYLGREQQHQDVEIDPASLPVATDSIDLVIMTHALSQSSDPHALLREVNRVLIPNGKLIVIDFNPVSLWGVRHIFQSWLDEAPWSGHYYTAYRIKDWTALLGFELLHHYRCGYVLPFNFQSMIDRSHILSKFLQRWLRFSSAINVFEFEKNTIPLTPFKKSWLKEHIMPPNVIRPSVGRGMKYEQ